MVAVVTVLGADDEAKGTAAAETSDCLSSPLITEAVDVDGFIVEEDLSDG